MLSTLDGRASLFFDAIKDMSGLDTSQISVLDFGCGKGGLVNSLCKLGLDTYGCDVDPYWEGEQPKLREIQRSPYKIPFDDESFDVVISTSVLEHAQNSLELFYEIKRVLNPWLCNTYLSCKVVFTFRTPHLCTTRQPHVAPRPSLVVGTMGIARKTQQTSTEP